jgi:hypothetical protein
MNISMSPSAFAGEHAHETERVWKRQRCRARTRKGFAMEDGMCIEALSTPVAVPQRRLGRDANRQGDHKAGLAWRSWCSLGMRFATVGRCFIDALFLSRVNRSWGTFRIEGRALSSL